MKIDMLLRRAKEETLQWRLQHPHVAPGKIEDMRWRDYVPHKEGNSKYEHSLLAAFSRTGTISLQRVQGRYLSPELICAIGEAFRTK